MELPSTSGNGLSGSREKDAATLTVEAVLWPSNSTATEAGDKFACLVLLDGIELGRATSFPFGPVALPPGRHDSRLALRFVSDVMSEVSIPLAKLQRGPRSMWLGVPPCRPRSAALDLAQAMQYAQTPEVPKVSITMSWPSRGELSTIMEGPKEADGEGAADATVGPACGSGPWARSAAPFAWQYQPGDGIAVKVRMGPEIDGPWEGSVLKPGEVFEVSQEVIGVQGVRFLRLADGRGWLFDMKPGVGVMCVRHRPGNAVEVSETPTPVHTGQSQAPGATTPGATPGVPTPVHTGPGTAPTTPYVPYPPSPTSPKVTWGQDQNPSPRSRSGGCTPPSCSSGPQRMPSGPQLVPGPLLKQPIGMISEEEGPARDSPLQETPKPPPRPAVAKPKALCHTGWVQNRRSLSPIGRGGGQETGSPRSLAGSNMQGNAVRKALCHSPDFMRNKSANNSQKGGLLKRGSQSVTLSSTAQHNCVPVVHDVNSRAADIALSRPEGSRSQTVTVPAGRSPRSQSLVLSSTNQHNAVPVVNEIGAKQDNQRVKPDTSGRVAELKAMFQQNRSQSAAVPVSRSQSLSMSSTNQHDMVPVVNDVGAASTSRQELVNMKAELTASRAAEMKGLFIRQDLQEQLQALRMELEVATQVNDEGKARDEVQKRELSSKLDEHKEALAEIRGREERQRQQLQALQEEAKEAKQLQETQLYLEEEVLGMSAELDKLRGSERTLKAELQKASGDLDQIRKADIQESDSKKAVESLRVREQELLAELKDATPPSEVAVLRAQLDEANAVAGQTAILQDEFLGLSSQLEAARLQESHVQEKLAVATAELGKYRSSHARQVHLEEEAKGLAAILEALTRKEQAQGEELSRLRFELQEAQRAREDLLKQKESPHIVMPEEKMLPLDLTVPVEPGSPSAADETDGRTLEDELKGLAAEVARTGDRRSRNQLHQVAEAAQVRQRSLQEMLRQSQGGQERRQDDELQNLRASLESSMDVQARQRMVLTEAGKGKSGRWSSAASQIETTTTTCSSEGSKDTAEENCVQAALLDALHGSEKQRQELQNQAVRQAAELASLHAREVQREEQLQALRKQMETAKEANDSALQTLQAKLACTELAKERMREHLLSELAELRNAEPGSGVAADTQANPPGCSVSERQFVSVCSDLEEALRAKERMRQDFEDLQSELLHLRSQWNAESADSKRSNAALCTELAAMRAELMEARGLEKSGYADGLQSTRLVWVNGVPKVSPS